ncbi:MAG: hypothetical protein JRN51_07445 [Nitrososphaerota archaeon]|nr:hypothetical protein [Nitrososphaerota archaeon]
MVDVTSLALLAASFFFVALSTALLAKYREVSKRINASTDLGRDLWSSLEQRLKKQDERILDMMGRFEVVQSRVLATSTVAVPAVSSATTSEPPVSPPAGTELAAGHSQPPSQQQGSQESQSSQATKVGSAADSALDETQMAALGLLKESPKNTRQLTDALGKSREHTARIMKELFEKGLVRRNSSAKPFVYQLTEEGQRRLPAP